MDEMKKDENTVFPVSALDRRDLMKKLGAGVFIATALGGRVHFGPRKKKEVEPIGRRRRRARSPTDGDHTLARAT